jgi:hypothetical protein
VENFGKVFKLPRSPRSPPHTPLCMRPWCTCAYIKMNCRYCG